MPGLAFSTLDELYPSKTNENKIQQTLKQNQLFVEKNNEYQEQIKQKEIAGKANYVSDVNSKENNNIPPNQNIPPNLPKMENNNSIPIMRQGWTNLLNNFPGNQGLNYFNRHQNIDYLSDHDQIVALLQEIIFVGKIIMILLVLILVCKIFKS